jgi:hypothetical protein
MVSEFLPSSTLMMMPFFFALATSLLINPLGLQVEPASPRNQKRKSCNFFLALGLH